MQTLLKQRQIKTLHIVDSQRHINNSLPQSRINEVAIFMLNDDMDTLLGLCQQLRF